MRLVYDLTRDGRTVVRGSFANYVDADAVRISKLALGEQVALPAPYARSNPAMRGQPFVTRI